MRYKETECLMGAGKKERCKERKGDKSSGILIREIRNRVR
jgi:hypothetical protein